MKILITGGAGCLGSNLIEHWLPKGHEILVLDNFATGSRDVVPNFDGVTIVEGSVSDRELVYKTFASFEPELVVHSAAAYKDPSDWSEDTATNVEGSINVIRASEQVNARQVVNFQTALCYGRPKTVPIPVDAPTAPYSSYGISKTAGEAFMLMSDLPVLSLRLSNITGPRLSIGPIPTFYRRLKAGQGCFCSQTVRDFLDITDFLGFMDHVIGGEPLRGVANLSTGEGHYVKDVFDLVCAHLGIDVPDVPIVPPGDDDVPEVVLDPSRTETEFGWKSKIEFAETISRQLQWYDAHGVDTIYSHLSAPKT